MARADMTYLVPLFELARGLLSDDGNPESVASFGLDEAAPTSRLARDDEGTQGYWVSTLAAESIGAALDHALTLSVLVERGQVVTTSAPWTLARGVVEPAATAVWVLSGSNRAERRERALRVWHHDMEERGKWERDLGEPPAGGRSGAARATQIIKLAGSLGLRERQSPHRSISATRSLRRGRSSGGTGRQRLHGGVRGQRSRTAGSGRCCT